MKIRQQSAHCAELKAGIDKYFRFARAWLYARDSVRAQFTLVSGVLQSSDRGGPHRNNPPLFFQSLIDLRRSGGGNRKILAMQLMLFHIFYVHRLKRPQTNVESEFG